MTLSEAFKVFAEKKPDVFKPFNAMESIDPDTSWWYVGDPESGRYAEMEIELCFAQDDADLVLEQFGLAWDVVWTFTPDHWNWLIFNVDPKAKPLFMREGACDSKSACASAVVIAVAEWLKGGGK